jgi:hypothetical protein
LSETDLHGFGKSTGPSGQIEQTRSAAGALHEIDSFQRLERAQKYSRPNASHLACDVQHERRPIREINVSVTPPEKHRAMARRLRAEGVIRRIANGICFRFDDPSAKPPRGNIVHHHFADQKTSQPDRIHRKLGAAETPEPTRNKRIARRPDGAGPARVFSC